MPAPAAVLELIDVSRRYRAGLGGCRGEVLALDRVNLRIQRAEAIGLLGSVGAGKTTLMLCAAGLITPDSGVVRGGGVAYVASVERLEELGESWRVVLLDLPAMPRDESQRSRLWLRCGALRAAGAALLIGARDSSVLRGFASRVLTLDGGRVVDAAPRLRTLELDVGMPGHAATLLASRLPIVNVGEGVLRVPLGPMSAEEVLSTCLAVGVRVRASRVLVESYARGDRVAEGRDC